MTRSRHGRSFRSSIQQLRLIRRTGACSYSGVFEAVGRVQRYPRILVCTVPTGVPVMPRLLLLRHGQTTAGDHAFLGSRSDPSLSQEGRAQAERLASALVTHPIAAVRISPLHRARETASLVMPAHYHHIDPRLREIDYGLFSGLTVDAAQDRFPAQLAAWQSHSVGPPGGES